MTTIRALRASDERSRFDSGDVELDRFFKSYAGQNQFKNHIGVSYVALDDQGVIVGYATVAAASVAVEPLPPSAKNRKKKLPQYPLPVLRLARLAVATSRAREGIGGALLRYVFELALRMSEEVGCVGILVDAYPTAVSDYAGYGFVAYDVLEGESSARPQQASMFVGLDTVIEATK